MYISITIINSIIHFINLAPALTSVIISSTISLYINLRKPRTKLEIVPYKINMGLQQYMGNTPKCTIQFCLLSNNMGWFKLTRIIYKPNILLNYRTVYDRKRNINNLPNNEHMVAFTSIIFVTSSKPSELFSFNYNNLKSFKQTIEQEINTELNKKYPDYIIPPINDIFTGNLICYFETNDQKQKEMVCEI